MGKQNSRSDRVSPFRSLMGGVGTVIFSFISVCIITGCIVGCVLSVYVLKYMGDGNDVDLNQIKLSYTSIIYAQDKNTSEFVELKRIANSENRIWVGLDQIPDNLVNAAIAGEDERFEQHHGVDWKRTLGAFVNQFIPIYKSTAGGSTITQQVIKNATGDDAYRVDRKVREIFRALNLEQHFSKDQIMETYLNILGLGNNCAGVQSAANFYFGKDVSELDICESAALIAITKSPTANDPFRNPEKNKIRRDWIITNMHDIGKITEEEMTEALNQELDLNTEGTAGGKGTINSINTWFEDYVIDRVISDLQTQKNMTYEEANQLFFQGGLRVYTTVDVEMQKFLQEFYANQESFPPMYNEEYPQGAFVITDLNGKILALAGGMGEKDQSRIFNRATDALRQPGSAIKPISSYPVAFEQNVITWSSLIADEPVWDTDGDGKPDGPKDHYGAYYEYPITVDLAVRRSANTIPAKLVKKLTPAVVFEFMKNKLNVQSLVESRDGQTDVALAPLSIGALTDGMTPLEMAGAYQMIGNGGTYTAPYCYTKVLDSEDNVVLEADTTPIRVVSTETATLLNRLLQRVTTGPQATGTTAKIPNFPVAGKTGTSDKDYNQWFAGISPYYIGVCWMGYDTEQTIRYPQYGPPIIWNRVMAPLHANLSPTDFEYSPNVVQKKYCTLTGWLASPDCASTDVGWYSIDNMPDECTYCPDGEDAELLHNYYILSEDYVRPDQEDEEGDGESSTDDGDGWVIDEDAASRARD